MRFSDDGENLKGPSKGRQLHSNSWLSVTEKNIQVEPKEEVEVEYKAITKSLRNDDSQEGANSDFRLFTSNNHVTSGQHCLKSN